MSLIRFVSTRGDFMGRRTNYHDVMVKERFLEVLEEFNKGSTKSAICELARKIGCNRQTIFLYINQDCRELSPEIVKKIAIATGVSMDWLYGLSDEKYWKVNKHD